MSELENTIPEVEDNQDEAKEVFAKGSLPARVIEITQRLTDILHQENELLRNRRVAETKELQGEKTRLSAFYQNEMRALQQNPSCLGEKDSPIRQKLKKVVETFQEEVKTHGRILLRLKTVSEGLVQSISNEAGKKAGAVPVYNTNAHMQQSPNSLPINIALNEVI